MTRLCLLMLFAGFSLVAGAAPVPADNDAAKLQRVYGTWSDVHKDAKLVLKGDELRVTLPAADRQLGDKWRGVTDNAPRVLREVEGDFTAVVRVTVPTPENVPQPCCWYWSGGLVAWESEGQNYVIRRCAGPIPGGTEGIWADHKNAPTPTTMMVQPLGNKPTGPTLLRLKREGNKVVSGWSRDGKTWRDNEPATVAWGAKVKVGVVAENSLGTAVEITFDQYSLTQPKK